MFKRFSAGDPVHRWSLGILAVILAGYLGWMLTLPSWPSQDGPVHLYYTRVFEILLSGAPSPFGHYFFIKHLLPPYAVYYYALLLLSHLMPLLAADRLVICGYFVSFVFGFRYAARAIGPNGERMTLLASLLLLNWALGMGFTNYCLSLSFSIWAIGLWLRLDSRSSWKQRAAFVALCLLITLSHPVPLLFVLSFGAVDLLCRYFFASDVAEGEKRRHLFPGVVTLALGSLCLLYVKAFTVAHPLQQRTVVTGTFAEQVVRRLKDIATVKNVEVLYGRWWEIRAYRGCLLLIAVLALFFAVAMWQRNRAAARWTPGDTVVVFTGCYFLALPMLPSDLSGAYYFTERLTMMLWVLMLLAASGWEPRDKGALQRDTVPRGWTALLTSSLIAVFALAATALLLHAANRTLRPFADRDYQMAHTELPLRGRLAMVLDGGKPRLYPWAGPPWDPFYWDAVALLRRNEGILVNAPWLDSPIIPLAPTAALPGAALPPLLANSPYMLLNALGQGEAVRSAVLDRSVVVVFSPIVHDGGRNAAALLGSGWFCRAANNKTYRFCMKATSGTEASLLP